MKQQLWSSLTLVLLVTAFGTTSSSHAEPNPIAYPEEAQSPTIEDNGQPEIVRGIPQNVSPETQTSQPEVIKVGEYQSQPGQEVNEEVITKIHAHEIAGQPAATLYIRDIPVLTFIAPENTNGSGAGSVQTTGEAASEGGMAQSPGTQIPNGSSETSAIYSPVENQVKVAATADTADAKLPEDTLSQGTGMVSPNTNPDIQPSAATGSPSAILAEPQIEDPVWRASVIAAQLNQLNRTQANPEITVRWHSERERYIIEVNGQELLAIDQQTQLPDTTNDEAEDALQITNRLRRLISKAPPLREIADRPKPKLPEIVQQAADIVAYHMEGWASWYGPGFHGNLSASGEIFNENDLTAAHRSLPFGTRVRVTNLNNGLSVVVRINDRGPYVGGRVIDLSAGAAGVLGMLGSGVAPVRLEILSP